MAHLSGHYWNYEYALLFSFFRPEQDQLPTQAQADIFAAEFKCLSDEEVQELVAALPSPEVIEMDSLVDRIQLTPLAKIQEPREFRDWIENLDEPWLSQKISDSLEYDDAWNTCVAVGLLARMGPMSGFTVDAVRRGETPNGMSRRWAQELAPNQLQTIEDLAFSELEGLHQALEALESSLGYEINDWQDDWVALCHGRDDLEGIRLILSEGHYGDRLERALTALDDDGMLLVLSLPRADVKIDERMSRAGILDPTAWWSGNPAWELMINRDASV